jgi:Xaa-Pro dipeptidase
MKSNFENRSKRIKDIMQKKGINAVVVLSFENVFYSTGAYIMTQKVLRDRLEIAVFSDKDPVFIVCGIEEKTAREESWIKDIRPYIEFAQSPIKILADVLQEIGCQKGVIAIEKHVLSTYHYLELIDVLPDIQIVEGQPIFDEVMMIKDEYEIETLREAAVITRKAVDAAFIKARPGMTEKQLADEINISLLQQGMDELSFMVLGTGSRSQIAHPIPSNIPLKEGDILRVDFGGLLRGYYSDLARTAAVGRPTDNQRETFKKLADIQLEVINNITIGKRFCDIFSLCAELFKKKDLPFNMPHIGHGLGIGLHEQPIINPFNQTEVQENMVLDVEPIVLKDGYGYHIEDLILTTKNGPEILTGSQMSNQIPILK